MNIYVDLFIVAAIVFFGIALFYSIWDCARRDFNEKCKYDEGRSEVVQTFIGEVSKQHPENKSLEQLYKDYADACKKVDEVKI